MLVEVSLASAPALLGGDPVLPILDRHTFEYHRLWVHDAVSASKEERGGVEVEEWRFVG